jgi:cytochrome c oxidase cbb3-type subunit III
LARNQLVVRDRDGDVLGPVIREGRPSKGMPAFPSFSREAILDIVAFLRSRAREERGILPETALLVGDAKAGQLFFNGVGKCNNCHSPTGDLARVGAKYQPLALTTAFLTPATNRPPTVKVTLLSGQVVSGVMRYIDEFAVALEDPAGEHRSWMRDSVKAVEVSDPLAAHREMLPKYTDPDIHNLRAYLVTLK